MSGGVERLREWIAAYDAWAYDGEGEMPTTDSICLIADEIEGEIEGRAPTGVGDGPSPTHEPLRLVSVTPELAVFAVDVRTPWDVTMNPYLRMGDAYISVTRDPGERHTLTIVTRDGDVRSSFATNSPRRNYDLDLVRHLSGMLLSEGLGLGNCSMEPFARVDVFKDNEGTWYALLVSNEVADRHGIDSRRNALSLRWLRARTPAEAIGAVCEATGLYPDMDEPEWFDASRGENRGHYEMPLYDTRPPIEERLAARNAAASATRDGFDLAMEVEGLSGAMKVTGERHGQMGHAQEAEER